jgi:hypothetical protein
LSGVVALKTACGFGRIVGAGRRADQYADCPGLDQRSVRGTLSSFAVGT